MTALLGVLLGLALLGLVVAYEGYLRHDFCRAALARSGFEGVAELDGHAAHGRKPMGASSLEVTLTPNASYDVAHVEAVFARAPDHPTLSAPHTGRGLFAGSSATLGWGGEHLQLTLSEATHCLGPPSPKRLEAVMKAYWVDLGELSVSDFLVTARATIYTSKSPEHARRRQALPLGEQLMSSHREDAKRDVVCSQALDLLVDLLASIDANLRRHAEASPEHLWRRAWRSANAPTPRAQALGVFARAVGEDAMWDEALALGDARDLAALWRRDDVRASARFGALERALIVSADRLDHHRLQETLRAQVEPAWLDALTWPQARPVILPTLRRRHGLDELAPFIARLAQRSTPTHRAELLDTLGADADALAARGGLSLSHDDARGALSPAADPGALTPSDQ